MDMENLDALKDFIQVTGEYSFYFTHCLEKVFLDAPPERIERPVLTALKGEKPALQLVYHYKPGEKAGMIYPMFHISVRGAPCAARLRRVEQVATDYPCHETVDSGYLRTAPGYYPDLLAPMEGDAVKPVHGQYRAVWIDFPNLDQVAPGVYEVSVTVEADRKLHTPLGIDIPNLNFDKQCFSLPFTLKVLPVSLPEPEVIHTEWFYADCLADYYKVPVFSGEHWAIVERFIAMAGKELGVNMLLTPVFTPPLNTTAGGERTTTQLVGITLRDGRYSFSFEKLEQWCDMCRKHGITHLEIAHLYTQWGALFTPKIIADTPEGEKRIFGWDVPADSEAYRNFLAAFLPALLAALEGFGYDKEHVVFHVSDEPMAVLGHLESYTTARRQLDGLLDGYRIMDALSDYEFYREGAVDHPVPTVDHAGPFLENKVQDLWVYYCTAQSLNVPNRFCAMPSARNRIMGVLMYLYGIKGFLHWGYNFYNDSGSTKHINPYLETSAGRIFPAGDSYLVYPGEEGEPLSSIRAEVQRMALDDIRLLQKLESLAGRERVTELIGESFGRDMTFFNYPRENGYLLELHEKVCAEIEKYPA